MNAAGVLQRRGLEGLFKRMSAARDAFAPYMRRYAPGSGDELPAEGMCALQENFDALTALTTNIADTIMLDGDATAQETGLPRGYRREGARRVHRVRRQAFELIGTPISLTLT